MITDEEIEKLAFNNYFIKTGEIVAESSRPDLVIGFIDGYKAALQQNKVSDVSEADNELDFWKNKARIASNEYLQVTEALNILQKHSPDFDDESGLYYRGDSVLKIMAEYASIVNERKDNVNDAIKFAEWIHNNNYTRCRATNENFGKWYSNIPMSKEGFSTTKELFEYFKSESQSKK